MKKFSLEAKELLSKAEMYEIKAGKRAVQQQTSGDCTLCDTCVACSESCMACTNTQMDVFIP